MKPTKLLAETAVKWAREYKLDYEITAESFVAVNRVVLDTRAGAIAVDLFTFDRNPAMEFLAVMSPNLIRFPDAQLDRVLDMCDRLNRTAMGKFITMRESDEEERMVVYCVECPITDGADYEVFKRTIEVAMSWIETAYPALTLALRGDMSADQAYDAWLEEAATPEEEE